MPSLESLTARLRNTERDLADLQAQVRELVAREGTMLREPVRLALVQEKLDEGTTVLCEVLERNAQGQMVPVKQDGSNSNLEIRAIREEASYSWAFKYPGRGMIWSFLNFIGVGMFEAAQDWGGNSLGGEAIVAYKLFWNGSNLVTQGPQITIRDIQNFAGKKYARGFFVRLFGQNWHLTSSCPATGSTNTTP